MALAEKALERIGRWEDEEEGHGLSETRGETAGTRPAACAAVWALAVRPLEPLASGREGAIARAAAVAAALAVAIRRPAYAAAIGGHRNLL